MKGAIFDMDGTLIDSLTFWGPMWKRIGRAYMGVADFLPDEAVDKEIRTMVYTDAMAHIHRHYRLSVGLREFLTFATDALADFYREVATLKPGAVDLLAHLRAAGVRLTLASATDGALVRLALSHHGLLPYFEAILSCSDIGVGKEKPDVFLASAKVMGTPVDKTVVFEDSALALQTAKNAGFATVGVYDSHQTAQDRLVAASDIYLKEGTSLTDALSRLEY